VVTAYTLICVIPRESPGTKRKAAHISEYTWPEGSIFTWGSGQIMSGGWSMVSVETGAVSSACGSPGPR
ncbi:unnamed protein product, partial [Gulo gulo]